MTLAKIKSGRRAEDLAVSFLKSQGYKIIEKNYRTKQGEIDIIGRDKDAISFIEVRSCNTEKFGLPEYSINKKKQRQISKIALFYIKRFGLEEEPCRFDVICVEGAEGCFPKVRLIKNAFELNSRYTY